MKLSISTRPLLSAGLWRPCATRASFIQSRSFASSESRRYNDDERIEGDGYSPSYDPLGAERDNSSFRESWLLDRRAIITGGSRGIGEAIAVRLAKSGARCLLVGREEWALKNAVRNLDQLSVGIPHGNAGNDAPSGVHSYIVGDVRDDKTWKVLFQTPNVSILINAAGITHNSYLSRTAPDNIRDIIGVNLYGTTLGCRQALTSWMTNRSRDRVIINISSLLAFRGGVGAAAYSASKAGIIGLTRAIADEGKARAIRANVIVPGYIETEMTERRFGRPSEVADAAFFLINNRYANNCVLNLDGGLSAV